MKPTVKKLSFGTTTLASVTLAGVILGGACEGNPPPFKNDPKPLAKPVPAEQAIAVPPTPVPTRVVVAPDPSPAGMAEPFKLMNAAGVNRLDQGWKALRRKDYAEARVAFQDVVTSYPDKPATRFAELRATVLAGDLAAVPPLWRELLARDYIGYAHRLDKGKEMAPLRQSPQWSQMKAISAEMKAKYLAALEQGVFFVGRLRPSATAVLTGTEVDGESVKLDLEQEVYHFDPGSERIQRVSDSGGKVLGIHLDGERRQMMVLSGGVLKKTGGKLAFANPQASVIDLDTLERTGPLTLDADATAVDLCFSGKGEPVWAPVMAGLREAKAFTPDATGTSLVSSEDLCGGTVATTSIAPQTIEHRRPTPEGVALSEDGLRLDGVDEEVPVRAKSAIKPGSFGWSPGKKRFVYTGSIERCQQSQPDPLGPSNGIYVWDSERKKSTKVTSAQTSFEATWMDDDRLAYQAGGDKPTKLTIHDFSPGGMPLVVKVPAGAGLFGIPTVGCEEGQMQALLPE